MILANTPALPADRVAALAAWTRAGGGLLVTGGDRVDPAAYAARMAPLLPQPVVDPIDVTWGAAPAEIASRALRLAKWDVDHPIFAPFSPADPGLADARTRKLLLLDPSAQTDRKILARFGNGAAALVEAPLGAGRLMLWTSTLDRDWTDLPIHPGFLPLVQGMVRYLARATSGPRAGEHLVGHAVSLPVGDLVRLEVRGPDGTVTPYDRERLIGRRAVRFDRADTPGLYRVVGAGPGGEASPSSSSPSRSTSTRAGRISRRRRRRRCRRRARAAPPGRPRRPAGRAVARRRRRAPAAAPRRVAPVATVTARLSRRPGDRRAGGARGCRCRGDRRAPPPRGRGPHAP
ncbi:MAG: hypothetical protein R2939_04900 [Kofleriaceae bacterium]